MAYDPKLNLIYIGVGNGSPWNPRFSAPAAATTLFLASIVALHADTGAYAWHYQTSPGEGWDYTATQHIMVADLKIEGPQPTGRDAGAKERFLLRARRQDGRADLCPELRGDTLGFGHRPENGSASIRSPMPATT